MSNVRLTSAISMAALFLFVGACDKAPISPAVLSPDSGQLLRDADSFLVEIQASPEFFDLETLQADLNGHPLDLSLGDEIHVAVLAQGDVLAEANELIVSAVRQSDQQVGSTTQNFSWKAAPSDETFRSEFVERPPVVEAADIEVLDPGVVRQNALLRVQFREGLEIPTNLPFRVDEQTVIELMDTGEGDDEREGDGVFTARIDFDYGNYLTRKLGEVMKAISDESDSHSLGFVGRELVEVAPFDVGATLTKLVNPMKITLVPLPVITPLVDSERALMIRDLSVVADPSRTFDPCDTDGDGNRGNPNGVWSFKTLMEGMANTSVTGIPVEIFVEEWLMAWAQNFDVANGGSATGDWIVNDDVVPNREVGLFNQIIGPWPLTSAGNLNLDEAPFRLLSVVNRVDLRDAVGYGVSTASAGELRFVFGLLDMNTCQPTRMTAIFEYSVAANTCADVLAYAQQWDDLDQLNPPFPASAAYLTDLENITNPVTVPGAAPGEPNDSSIGQLRTSEVVMGSPWEMREFTLQQRPGALVGQNVLRLDTTKQTPDLNYTLDPAMQPVLTSFINTNSSDVCDGTHVVPNTWLGLPFMSGRSDFFPNTHFWSPGIAPFPFGGCTNDDIRFNFSSNTCSGCHGADTIDPGVDPPFYHVHPDTPPGLPARLSRFLTGTGTSPIPDPSPIGGIPRSFSDLDRRAVDLQSLLAIGCPTLVVAPLDMALAVH
ncbi:MAG: hypothetical protein VCC04_11830 [Myxococcota bacterium]